MSLVVLYQVLEMEINKITYILLLVMQIDITTLENSLLLFCTLSIIFYTLRPILSARPKNSSTSIIGDTLDNVLRATVHNSKN